MKALVCDRCSAVITGEDETKKATEVNLSTSNVGIYQTIHFCDKCLRLFIKFKNNEVTP